MKNSYFVIAALVLLMSCNATNEPSEISSQQFKEDSLSILNLFAKGLSHPDSTGFYFEKSLTIAGNNSKLQDYVRYSLARNYIMLGRFSKADSVTDVALKVFQLDSLNHATGKYYNLKGSILIYQSQQSEGMNYFKKALEVFEKHEDLKQAAAIEFNMAQLFLGSLEYPKVYEYSMSSHKKLEALSDTLYLPIVKGLAAVSSAIEGKLKEAEVFAAEGLEMSERYNNTHGRIFAKYAYGEIETQKENFEKAIAYLNESKELAQKAKLYQVVLPNNAAMLKCYLLLKEYDSAVAIGEESLKLSEQLKLTDIRYNLLKNTAKAYAELNNYGRAYEYMADAEELFRSKSNKSNQKIIHELLIKYDDQKKNNQILLQQKKIAKKNQSVYILGGIVFIILLVLFFYRRNNLQEKKLFNQSKEKAIMEALDIGEEKERTRLADELHDGIASNLTAVKLQLESSPFPKEETIKKSLELINHTNKELRYLAQRMAPANFEKSSLKDSLKDFCEYCSIPSRKIHFLTNVQKVNRDPSTKIMLFRSAQELVQNAIKHSSASEITVQLLSRENNIQLLVEDNGRGFDLNDENSSSGFESLNRRVKMFNGNMEIGSVPGKGTSVFISL
ncbi:MAG: ATP-binding protein [Ginsengibacter sp.]